jgi:hypothetical protein
MVSEVEDWTSDTGRTQHVAVLCEEGCVGAEVDATPNYIQRAKLGPVILPGRCVVENLPIVTMVGK